MLHGVFALFFRSLRGDARSIWVHLCWFLLLVVIYAALCMAQVQSMLMGAPGLNFFRSVIYADAVFVTLLGISYFSSAISEEKEEDTLGLMTMAGISPLGILLGKSTTRLFQVFLLLAVQYPFTLLAVTLGGLLPAQIIAAYAALIAYTTLLANAGLFCSVLCRRNRDAAGLTVLCVVAYSALPIAALILLEFCKSGSHEVPGWLVSIGPVIELPLQWIAHSNIFGQLTEVTQSTTELGITPQLVTNLLGAAILFFLSWWLFGYVSHEPITDGATRAMVPRKTGRLRWFSAGRAWNAAIVWKDFHFVAGGWFAIAVRCSLYIGLYWLAFAAIYPWYETQGPRQVRWEDATSGYQFFVIPLFIVDATMCLSRLFQDEIRQQTLASLLMLPHSVPHIVYSKVAGCLCALIPGMVAIVAAFFLLDHGFTVLLEILDETWFWWTLANFLLVIHLSAMLSTYLRWGAFAMALGLTLGSIMLSTMIVGMLLAPGAEPATVFGLLSVAILGACACCHLIVLLRVPALGEK